MSDSDKHIFFRSLGILRGKYLPSDDDSSQGIFMTEHGIFPTTCRQDLLRFLTKNKNLDPDFRKGFRQRQQFLAYLYGLDEPPYYHFSLIDRFGTTKLPPPFLETNSFLSQGIVTERTSEEVLLKVQKNLRPNRDSQEITDSVNFLILKNCSGKVRTSQFWSIRSSFHDGFLHFQSGELLAHAKTVKNLFQSYFKK